jgi:hypothetical protein
MVTAEELCKEWKELINTPDGRQNAIKVLARKYSLPESEIGRMILEVL